MNENITITGIVPIYNMEKYLTQCLESIVGQSIAFDEVILINDGSTDASRKICEKFVLRYDYFILINQQNRGLSAARNVGLDCASSEYVLFLDSDDCLKKDMIKQLKKELKKCRHDALYFNADIQCEKGYEVRENIYERDMKDLVGVQMSGETFFLRCYPENYLVPVWLAIYKKKAIEEAKILFPEGLYYEDNFFTFAFMIHAKNVKYLPEKLYRRRCRENSITTSEYSEEKFVNYIKVIQLIWKTVRETKDIALPENVIFMNLINNYCLGGLQYYHLCMEHNIKLHHNTENEFYNMLITYRALVDCCYIEDKIKNLPILNGILKNLKKIVLYYPRYELCVKHLMERMESKKKQLYKKLLCKIPLNVEKSKVGIYGTGKHTEGLIAGYEKLIGEIVCNLIFIDSYQEGGQFLGRDVIQYREIDSSFDIIVISSFRYKCEMIENVRNIDKHIPIYTFYDYLKEDVFSEVDFE